MTAPHERGVPLPSEADPDEQTSLMLSLPAWVRARAISMGFQDALTRDPLLWIVLIVAAGIAAYQGVRKDGAWALFDFVVDVWALGNLAGWARSRLARSQDGQQETRNLWFFRTPLIRDWLFGVCLLAAVVSGLITGLRDSGEPGSIAFFAVVGFFQAALILGLLRAFIEGYRKG